jgi:hypothetical protein
VVVEDLGNGVDSVLVDSVDESATQPRQVSPSPKTLRHPRIISQPVTPVWFASAGLVFDQQSSPLADHQPIS